MTTEEKEIYEDDEFIISLTIDGTAHEGIEVKVTDPNKTIREQIASIVAVFKLPKLDNSGTLIRYWLGQIMDGGEEPEILDFEDEEGREMALIDYNIQPGDHLHLISEPIPAGLWANIIIVKTIDLKLFKFQKIRFFEAEDRYNHVVCGLYGWIDRLVKDLVTRFRLSTDCQYYLAKLITGAEGLRLFFLNCEEVGYKYTKSIFDYAEVLSRKDNEYPTVILFPTTGISPRIMHKIEKYYNRKPKFITI